MTNSPKNEDDPDWGEFLSKSLRTWGREAFLECLKEAGEAVYYKDGKLITVYKDGRPNKEVDLALPVRVSIKPTT